jgi:hypothetical protein
MHLDYGISLLLGRAAAHQRTRHLGHAFERLWTVGPAAEQANHLGVNSGSIQWFPANSTVSA